MLREIERHAAYEFEKRSRRTVAFFGHDAADAAVRRRVQAFTDDGLAVIGFMMRRRPVTPDWENIHLGDTRDSAFAQRLIKILAGSRIAAHNAERLSRAEVIYARNLDMLICAFLARQQIRAKMPIIYESLDIHRMLTSESAKGRALRRVEKWLLRRTDGLVVSSPAYLRNHFDKHYAGLFNASLVENRLAFGANYGARPVAPSLAVAAAVPARLRIGWVGILRCHRSLHLLGKVADSFPDTVEVRLHGIPSRTEIPDFEATVAKHPNMVYAGPYKSPQDLGTIYAKLDVVWAGDFMEAGANSQWLLPNRIYEGGFYATPSIAPAETETADWIAARSCGFVLPEPLECTLPELVARLQSSRQLLNEKVAALLRLDAETFIQPRGLLAHIVEAAIARSRHR